MESNKTNNIWEEELDIVFVHALPPQLSIGCPYYFQGSGTSGDYDGQILFTCTTPSQIFGKTTKEHPYGFQYEIADVDELISIKNVDYILMCSRGTAVPGEQGALEDIYGYSIENQDVTMAFDDVDRDGKLSSGDKFHIKDLEHGGTAEDDYSLLLKDGRSGKTILRVTCTTPVVTLENATDDHPLGFRYEIAGVEEEIPVTWMEYMLKDADGTAVVDEPGSVKDIYGLDIEDSNVTMAFHDHDLDGKVSNGDIFLVRDLEHGGIVGENYTLEFWISSIDTIEMRINDGPWMTPSQHGHIMDAGDDIETRSYIWNTNQVEDGTYNIWVRVYNDGMVSDTHGITVVVDNDDDESFLSRDVGPLPMNAVLMVVLMLISGLVGAFIMKAKMQSTDNTKISSSREANRGSSDQKKSQFPSSITQQPYQQPLQRSFKIRQQTHAQYKRSPENKHPDEVLIPLENNK